MDPKEKDLPENLRHDTIPDQTPSLGLYVRLLIASGIIMILALRIDNPDWHDFLLNLSTEIIGAVIILIIVDRRLRRSEIAKLELAYLRMRGMHNPKIIAEAQFKLVRLNRQPFVVVKFQATNRTIAPITVDDLLLIMELEQSDSQKTSSYNLFPYYVQYQSSSNDTASELEPFQGLPVEPKAVLDFQIFFHPSQWDLSLPSSGMLILSVYHRFNEEATKWVRCYPSYMYTISDDLVDKWNDPDMSGDLIVESFA